MTPTNKIKFKNTAQVRSLAVLAPGQTHKRLDSDHYVEGYAAKYEPYILFYDGDTPIYERFEHGCFDGCDMSDIVYLVNHEGRVLARTSNGSLIAEADDVGLFMAADLGRTNAARDHYDDDIKTGMITKMSWRFATGEYYFDQDTNTLVHTKIRKVYDVSAVSIPANDNTEINARAWGDGVIAQAARSEAELDERRRKLRTKININLGGINHENH